MAPPVKVFGSAVFANAARVMACLEEVGVEYEVVEVDYTAMEHKGPQHLSKNVRNTASLLSRFHHHLRRRSDYSYYSGI